MSTKKITKLRRRVRDAQRWRGAILDAQSLLSHERDGQARRRLQLAMEWFQFRLDSCAPYPDFGKD